MNDRSYLSYKVGVCKQFQAACFVAYKEYMKMLDLAHQDLDNVDFALLDECCSSYETARREYRNSCVSLFHFLGDHPDLYDSDSERHPEF